MQTLHQRLSQRASQPVEKLTQLRKSRIAEVKVSVKRLLGWTIEIINVVGVYFVNLLIPIQ